MSNAGSSTIKGPFIANGGATFSNNNFKIEVNTGNSDINGSVNIHNNLVVDKDTFIEGSLSCNSGAFRISEDVGALRVDINGQLHVTGTTTYYDTFKLNNSNDVSVISLSSRDDGKSYFLGGNVGFGVSDPEYKIDVFGNINVSSGNTYKIGGVDVVFSQWETIFNKDIKFNGGNVFINISEPSNTSDSKLTVGGNIKIASGGNLILNGKSFEENVLDIIPENPWVNEPIGSSIESGNLEHLYTNYPVMLAKNMSIGTSLNSDYSLNVLGDVSIEGKLFFNGSEFIPNIWKVYENDNAQDRDAQYIYFSTPNDPNPAISYVGIGNSAPKYNLDVNGDINITGNLLINGNGVIFPDPEDGDITSAAWKEGVKTNDGTVLYYNSGFVGIGTATPITPLQIRGSLNSNGQLFDISSQNYASFFTISRYTNNTTFQAGLIGFTQNTNELTIQNTLADGSINISNSGSGKIYMNLNGDIGLGTSNPKDNLHVKGGATFEDNINIIGDGTSLIINNPTSVGSNDNKSRIALQHGSNDMLLMDPNSGYGGGIKLGGTICIIPQSNTLKHVGIANAQPQYQLDVDGDINYSQRLLKNGIEQFPSQWFTQYDGAEEYITYPRLVGGVGSITRVGIGSGGKPSACLEVFDRKVSATQEFYPQLMLKSSIDKYENYDKGACIELNTYNTSDSRDYKGIRLRTICEGLPSFVGFGIDTNNANNTTTPFVNLCYLNAIGNLGIGNFLNTNRQDVRARLHLLNPTTDQPALIISDNNNPNNPELNVSDLNIICSKSDPKNLGKYSKIIGLNIEHAISNNNTLIQNANSADASGAVAINLSAGGSQGGANNKGANGSAFGVLFTNATGVSGAGVELQEQFSIAYNGNVGIRSYSTTNATKMAPKYGLNINHSDDDNDATGRPTGSINISGYYYTNGKKLHLPWTYWDDGTANYESTFDIAYANATSQTVDTSVKTILKNNIHQLDSVVGIGTSQPRGALDVEGSIYSRYGVISSDKLNASGSSTDFAIYHSRFEVAEDVNNPSKYTLRNQSDGHVFLNSQNGKAIFLSIDGSSKIRCQSTLITMSASTLIEGDTSIQGTTIINGTTDIQGTVNITGNTNITGTTNIQGNTSISGTCYANEFRATSDMRLKENIIPLENALEKINSLNGVSFKFKNNDTTQIGFIAQDIEKIIPEVVDVNENDHKTVAYGNVTAMLVEAVKELTQQNKDLLKRIEILENK